MSTPNTAVGPHFFEIGPIRIRKRFSGPNSPEGFKYGFVFRLIYCLVAFFFSILTVLVVSGLASLMLSGSVNPTSNILVGVALITFSIPVFLGEVLRRRILDFTNKSDGSSVTVELSASGLAFDGSKILNDWELRREAVNKISEKADRFEKIDASFLRFRGAQNFERNLYVHGYSRVYLLFGKRILDFLLVLLMLPVLCAIMAMVAIMIRITDGGPTLYYQWRVGRNGRAFKMWKFRTLVVNADMQLKQIFSDNPELKAEWEQNRMLDYDPRITRIGRFLRATSLDELPQLFNVLKGDMSFVGPRPFLVSQKELYPGKSYYRLRPGVTGFWQISSRNSSSFVDRARYDDLYELEASLLTDLGVMFRTAGVVMRATGV